MSLTIKARRVHELARRLAERRGTTLTSAVEAALEEALARGIMPEMQVAERLDAIARRCAERPRRDHRTAEEILGYDDNGLPR